MTNLENTELELMENQETMNSDLPDLPEDGVEQPEKLDLKNGALLGLAVAGGIAIVSGGGILVKKGLDKVKKWKADRAAKKAEKADKDQKDENPDPAPEPEPEGKEPEKKKK